ncbi:PqqD family protein [Petrocella atlantisensis]|uniref:PqqD family protein n=1 Tax=Petrocella atlantisensis TaxID=2173034 RepID=A0A3P7NTG1_9FIRM|nr:PqqD family peptide modification chaperone [Petrocella atlantisensis]MCF8018777.1 PqqD family peptide modification chaperone [Vallitaleaceae bacterium]VDN46145.1 PqqD family protein [Petrocella atlantisensis]
MASKKLELKDRIIRREDISTTIIDGELGMMSEEKGKYYTLDFIGTRVWELIEQPMTVDELIVLLMKEYEVDRLTCEVDLLELLNKLLKEELIKMAEA